MATSNDFLSIEVDGVGGRAIDFDKAERQVQNEINRTMRILEKQLPNVVRPWIPEDTGSMRDSLRASLSFRASRVRLTISVSGERDGYNYTRTTREGHRTPIIVPTHASKLRVPVGGRHSGRVVLKDFVMGYHPPYDWGEKAGKSAETMVEVETQHLGRSVRVAVLDSMSRLR